MDPTEFVRAHTTLGTSPDLPEIRLHMASDAFALWERTERESGGDTVSAPPFWAFPWPAGRRWPGTCSTIATRCAAGRSWIWRRARAWSRSPPPVRVRPA